MVQAVFAIGLGVRWQGLCLVHQPRAEEKAPPFMSPQLQSSNKPMEPRRLTCLREEPGQVLRWFQHTLPPSICLTNASICKCQVRDGRVSRGCPSEWPCLRCNCLTASQRVVWVSCLLGVSACCLPQPQPGPHNGLCLSSLHYS